MSNPENPERVKTQLERREIRGTDRHILVFHPSDITFESLEPVIDVISNDLREKLTPPPEMLQFSIIFRKSSQSGGLKAEINVPLKGKITYTCVERGDIYVVVETQQKE